MNFKKLLSALAVSSALASGSALATPFTMNVAEFDTTLVGGTDGITGLMYQMGVNWSATSTFTDDNGVAGVNTGDSVIDVGFGSINTYLDNSAQAIAGGFEGNEGVGGSHLLRFNYTDLSGNVVFNDGAGNILAKYTSGTINVYNDNNLDGDTTDAGEGLVLSLNVFDSFGNVGNLVLLATVGFANPNTFFFDGVTDWTDLTVAIGSRIDFNLDPQIPLLIGENQAGDDLYQRTATLDGSVAFEVPEPGVLALLGMGFAGIGFARRNKKQI